MDQNSEVLNRSITELLQKVRRARRLRAVTALALGAILFLYSFLPVILHAIAGESSIPHRAVTGALSILTMGYGAILLVFGVRARIFYQKHVRKSILRTIIFYALLIGFLFIIEYLATKFLAFLGYGLIGRFVCGHLLV